MKIKSKPFNDVKIPLEKTFSTADSVKHVESTYYDGKQNLYPQVFLNRYFYKLTEWWMHK